MSLGFRRKWLKINVLELILRNGKVAVLLQNKGLLQLLAMSEWGKEKFLHLQGWMSHKKSLFKFLSRFLLNLYKLILFPVFWEGIFEPGSIHGCCDGGGQAAHPCVLLMVF